MIQHSDLFRKDPATQVPTLPQRDIASEPRWRAISHYSCRELPPDTRPWLLDDGSLTARLTGLNVGAFAVRRLYQGWQVPLPSERRLLGLPPRQTALLREVSLSLAGQPVVFARSLFPLASLTGSLAHLRRLQNRSLGEILFRHPGMHRSPFELARMPGDSERPRDAGMVAGPQRWSLVRSGQPPGRASSGRSPGCRPSRHRS